MLLPPTLADIYRARARLQGTLPRTRLAEYPALAREAGFGGLWVKHENHLPTGAFKVRGGMNLVATLAEQRRDLRVITASTGNHGQSIALASRQHGVPCTILVPVGNNPDKNAAMRAYGAEVVEHGRDFDEAREEVERRVAAAGGGLHYIHSADEPLLIAGVGTYALEIFEELPAIDVVFVAIGGGSGASGLVTVRNALGLRGRTRIIGVQAANADAFARSWRTGTRVTGDRADTFAEGVATRVTFDLPFGILSQRDGCGLDDLVTLSEAQLMEGVRLALQGTHNLAEGAGAAALMAAWTRRHALAGKRVVCVMSGGNLNLATLRRVLDASATSDAAAASASTGLASRS